MTWTPPESLEEKAKRLFVPPNKYIKYLHKKSLRKGEKEINLISFLAKRDKISLDIGANKGIYSYALLPYSAGVHAFEPNPKLFGILRSWAEGKVFLHDIALGDRTGEADLLIPKNRRGYSNQGGSLSREKVTGDHGVVRIRTARLDDLGIENIGFMKIDVEGFECQVLDGARETLRRERPNLLIEIEEKHTKRPLPEIVGEVCGYGYECFALVRGSLTRFAEIDLDRHHRAVGPHEDYVFNFIFLPV